MAILNQTIDGALARYAQAVADCFEADVFAFYGNITDWLPFRTEIERLTSIPREGKKPDRLAMMVCTDGGVVEIVERMVEIMRHHYDDISFIVAELSMSAGTILCLSGNRVYMDYSSAMGPIDPQVVNNDGQLVPALGYLDQVARFIEKSRNNDLTDAEFAILQNQDLALLRGYEQAKDLSIQLLKKWLVAYKFKDWRKHSSTGDSVTKREKEDRAEEIARDLSDHNRWRSHSRMIGIDTLREELRLQIEDMADYDGMQTVVRQYSDFILDYNSDRGRENLFVGHALNPQGRIQ